MNAREILQAIIKDYAGESMRKDLHAIDELLRDIVNILQKEDVQARGLTYEQENDILERARALGYGDK